jgi:catechol 2,3-dioxygenase-like lactoylglutathione lyase family enzyme
MKPKRILETCLYVDDLEKANSFYSNILGLEFYSRMDGRHVFFYCGGSMLLLFKPEKTLISEKGIPAHGAKGPGHVAFEISEREFDGWLKKLSDNGIEIENEVLWPEGGKSIYFRDPAGNSLEFSTSKTWGF